MSEPAVPPDALRNAILKTATFVAGNGAVFEQRLRTSEATNPKFAFLKPDNEFHAYYKAQVAAKSAAGPASAATPDAAKPGPAQTPAPPAAPSNTGTQEVPAAPAATPVAAPSAPASPAVPAKEAPAPAAGPPKPAAPAAPAAAVTDTLPALATPQALRAFMGTGALLATADDFLADEILADEVLELIEEELDGINGKPLSKPARDAFWLRRLLYSVEPLLVFKHGDMLEQRFSAVTGLLGVPPAALAVELSNMGIKTSMVPPLLRALAPLRAAAARATPAPVLAAPVLAAIAAAAAEAPALSPAASTPPPAGPPSTPSSPAPSPAGSSAPSPAGSTAPSPQQSPPSADSPVSPDAVTPPPPFVAATMPESPPAAVPVAAPAQPSLPAAQPESPELPPLPTVVYGHSTMTREELEEKKKQFRMEQMARRQANQAKREAAMKADSGAYIKQQREMQEIFATGDIDMFAARFLRPAAQQADEPKAPPAPPLPTVAALAQSVAPSLSDEQRVLTLLSEQLAAERAAAKERAAAELVLRMQDTLVNVLPPLRTPEVIEREQARIKEEERRRREEEMAISCAVQ